MRSYIFSHIQMNTLKIIITGILWTLFMIGIFYLGGWYAVGSFIVSIGIYALFAYSIAYLWRKVRKKQIPNPSIFIQNFLFSISIIMFILVGSLSAVSYYFNEVHPATMEEYTLSNKEKTVKFQTMVHIGKKEFYEQVSKNLQDFKKEWAVYFYEWVKPGSKESAEKFDQALGVKFDKDLYKNVSKLYGVEFQDNSLFLWQINDKDINVDISLDEIVALYEQKESPSKAEEWEPLDASKEILALLNELNPKELQLLQYLNQALLNAMIGNESILNGLENFQNPELFEVILHERNKVLADAILASKEEKIFITYGKLHFSGVLKLLKESDERWKVVRIKKLYPIH